MKNNNDMCVKEYTEWTDRMMLDVVRSLSIVCPCSSGKMFNYCTVHLGIGG